MAKSFNLRDISDSLAWNIFLMLAGAFVFVVGYNGIAAHHDFVPGALYGFCVVLQKLVPQLTLSQWYLLLNVPMFTMALKGVSKRFFFLNMLTMGTVTLLTTYVQLDLGIHNEMYAAIASGAIMGAGCGMILRTYGGGGGLDVVAVILNRRFGVRIGMFYFVINAVVMGVAISGYAPDTIIASLVMQFISSVLTEYILSMFNQRKAVRIISRKSQIIVHELTRSMKMHATIIPGKGGYTGQPIDMVYSITDNLRLRSLEQAVFDIDANAIFIVENTFSVIGQNIYRRKTY